MCSNLSIKKSLTCYVTRSPVLMFKYHGSVLLNGCQLSVTSL